MPREDLTDIDSPSNDSIVRTGQLIRTQRRVVGEETGVLRAELKRFRSAGGNNRALTEAVKYLKWDGDGEVLHHLRDVTHYYFLLRGTRTQPDQGAIFDGWDLRVGNQTQADTELWVASENGRAAGRSAIDIAECPYDPGSELRAAWLSEHKRGAAAIKRELGPQGEPAPATQGRVRRGANGNGAEHPLADVPDVMAQTGGKPPRFAREPSAKRGRGRPKGSKNKVQHAAA